ETYSSRRAGSAMSTWLTSPWPTTARPARPSPEPASASSTSRKRAALPLRRKRVVPSLSRVRAIFRLRSPSRSSISTSAKPTLRLPLAPWKIRSVLSSARNELALPPPVVHLSASMMFDLPEPLGPTIAVTPSANSIAARSPKLLKPCSVRETIRTTQDNPCRGDARLLFLVLFDFFAGRQGALAHAVHVVAKLVLQLGDTRLHAVLELVETLAQADDLLHPRQVHSQLLGEAADLSQLLDVALRVQSGLALSEARLDQDLAHVEPQGIRVHVDELGRHDDDVEGLVAVDAS